MFQDINDKIVKIYNEHVVLGNIGFNASNDKLSDISLIFQNLV